MSEKNAVRFGIVGLGSMGLDHAKNIIANVKEAKLTAVATKNAANIAALHATPGGEAVRALDTPEQMAVFRTFGDCVFIVAGHRRPLLPCE